MLEGQLSVALLLSELDEVKEICSVFRKLGIIPHFYEDLKTFWEGSLENTPALCIVDVKLMSDGELALHDHPSVLSEKLPLAFYYSTKTEPLLISTNDFYHYGLIKKADHYEGQLRALLKRLNHHLKLERENLHLRKERNELSTQVDKLENDKIKNEQIDYYQLMVKSVCLDLEKYRGESEFFKALEKVLQSIDEIAEFSLLELSFNGQKLMSPLSHVAKFRTIPSMWLGQSCLKGIELFAQNMANQVALDILGADIVSIQIKGDYSRPDKMLFIKAKNELFFNHFDWNMFEAFLNGFYSSFKQKIERNPFEQKRLISTFEALSFIDQFLYGVDKKESITGSKRLDYRLIDVDFTPLIEMILKKSNNRFYWSKFEKEFINKLEIQARTDFKVFESGAFHMGFLIDARNSDEFFELLKNYAAKFSYWKYFEDSDSFVTKLIQPKTQMIPVSAYAYLKNTMGELKQDALARKESTFEKIIVEDLTWDREADPFNHGNERIHEV